ncbi:MAG: excinuclease ABC subunit UvrC, partial [Candidatus Eremiobacteraeota bacterium]|nr:excinuclease ABC subunit UvrC [Candidatus Eremiobacteraeota bacterium]
MNAALQQRLAQIPDAPGVYQMFDAAGDVLYIGKAVSLRSRVRSYFQESAAHHVRTVAMVERVVDVQTIVVTNEIEALILEANLIKRYQPPYNVRLRDDKRFPYLKVTNEAFPRVVFTRVVKNDGARYFGPYTDAHGLRELIDLVRLVFPLRTCREPIDGKRHRPCLQYHIKRCLAPCVGYQSEDDYDAMIEEVVLFLEGKQESLLARLQGQMVAAAETYSFETAARMRDRIVAVRRVTEKQKVVWRSRLDMDLIACARAQGQACMQVFMVRGGKLIGQEHFMLDGVHEQSDADLFDEFLKQFYTARTGSAAETPGISAFAKARTARDNSSPMPEKRVRAEATAVPKELLVQAEPTERAVIESWLSTLKGQRVRALVPQRGPRAEYLRLVQKNAEQNLKAYLAHQEVQESAQARSLTELADALELPEIPHRIECYDISNIQGTNPVASMVVFVEGRAKKSDYRKFKIQYDKGPNDFAMMQETLRRRLRYLRKETDEDATRTERELAKKEKFDKRPGLLLIDGGKGQLHAVVEILEEMDMTGLPVAGLAKEHEWLYLPGQNEPIVLAPNSAGLHLVMRIRDEA